MSKGLYITAILACMATLSYAQTNNSLILKGNKLYEEKKYKEASQEYEKALQKNPNNLPGIFNLGNSLYQQGQLDASRKVLAAAAKTANNKDAKGQANYNIGNTYMQEKKWEDAVDYYKQALRNNPQDADAKYNLSYALEMMKKQNGGGGKNNKDQKNKDQQNKDKQNQQNKDQQKKDQQNKDQQNKDQKDKGDQNKDQQHKDQQDKNDQQHPQSQPSKLSEKQADQLLNALQQEEKKLQDKKQKEKGVPVRMEKDW
ncbi:MAG: tetratricopeptide repeat protein [Bacteroidetes bacterium]|nr:tetratricopeptide repeat protein [Bacteroidota bacterium]